MGLVSYATLRPVFSLLACAPRASWAASDSFRRASAVAIQTAAQEVPLGCGQKVGEILLLFTLISPFTSFMYVSGAGLYLHSNVVYNL